MVVLSDPSMSSVNESSSSTARVVTHLVDSREYEKPRDSFLLALCVTEVNVEIEVAMEFLGLGSCPIRQP